MEEKGERTEQKVSDCVLSILIYIDRKNLGESKFCVSLYELIKWTGKLETKGEKNSEKTVQRWHIIFHPSQFI